MRVSITPAATARVRKQLAKLGVMGGVIIHRGPANADLKRGARGEVIWDIKPSAPWQAHVFPLIDWPQLARAEAKGITFLLLAGKRDASATFNVSVKGGKLYVAAAA